MKHTKGQWKADGEFVIAPEAEFDNEDQMMYECSQFGGKLIAQGLSDSDARLIAAAPEMYDLLEGIARVIRSVDNDPNYSLPSHIAGIAPKIEELLCKITNQP